MSSNLTSTQLVNLLFDIISSLIPILSSAQINALKKAGETYINIIIKQLTRARLGPC